jgi:hypothetical protein
MNARIEAIRERNAAQREALAMIAEVMLLTEFLDRTLLDLRCFSFADVEVYGEVVRVVRFAGVDYTIYCNGVQWTLSELATEAVEFAFGTGLLNELTYAA